MIARTDLFAAAAASLLALSACASPTPETDAMSSEGAASAAFRFQAGEYEAPGMMPPFDSGMFLRIFDRGGAQYAAAQSGKYACSGPLDVTGAKSARIRADGCTITLTQRATPSDIAFDATFDVDPGEELDGFSGEVAPRIDAAYRATYSGSSNAGKAVTASVLGIDRGSASSDGDLRITLTIDGVRRLDDAALTRTAADRFENDAFEVDLFYSEAVLAGRPPGAEQKPWRGLLVVPKQDAREKGGFVLR